MIKQLFNKIGATWWSAIVSIFIIFILVFFHFRKIEPFPWSDFICNIATELLGITFTIVFVDKLFNRYDKIKAKREESEKIARMHNLAFFYIKQYMYHLHSITTPMEKKFQGEIKLETPFSLQDLQYLYTPTLLVTESFRQTSIEYFFQYEQEVKQAFINMLNTINFEFYPDLSKIIQDFIHVSTKFYARAVILDNVNIKTFSETFVNMLKGDDIYEKYDEYKKNELKANGIMPYFMLYDMLKEEQKILSSYISEMKKIDAEYH